MSWSRALSYAALAAVLVVVLWATAPPAPSPLPSAPAQTGPDIVGVSISAGGHRVVAGRVDGRWQVAPPHNDAVTSDLVDALLAAVLNAPAEPVAPSGAGDEFGL